MSRKCCAPLTSTRLSFCAKQPFLLKGKEKKLEVFRIHREKLARLVPRKLRHHSSWTERAVFGVGGFHLVSPSFTYLRAAVSSSLPAYHFCRHWPSNRLACAWLSLFFFYSFFFLAFTLRERARVSSTFHPIWITQTTSKMVPALIVIDGLVQGCEERQRVSLRGWTLAPVSWWAWWGGGELGCRKCCKGHKWME